MSGVRVMHTALAVNDERSLPITSSDVSTLTAL